MDTLINDLKNFFNFPELEDKELAYIYNLGAHKCQTGDYANAIPLFQFLVLNNFSNIEYIKALAGALHGAKNFKDSLALYKIVYQLSGNTQTDCLFYMADCFLQIDDQQQARSYLQDFLKYEEEQANPSKPMIKRAKLLLESVLRS